MGKQAGKLAFCGVATALSLVILLLTAIPVTEISLAVLAGMIGAPVVIEVGNRYGWLSYIAASILALLLVPSVEGKGLYIALFGYYPVLKAILERHSLPRAAEWGIKLGVFNLSMIAAYWVMLRFFHLDGEVFTFRGVSLPWLFLLAGNGVFWLYDWCLTRLISVYMLRFHARIRRLFRF